MSKIFDDMPKSPLLRAVLALCAITAFLSISLAIWVAVKPPVVVASPIVHFSNGTVTPDKESLCPGDALTFSFSATVDSAPAVIVITYSWWSVDLQDTAVFGEEELFSIRTEPGTMTKTMSIKIPPLDPGKYEFRFGSTESYTLPTILVVPFSIPEGCLVTATPQL
jgi:hypothetical protein